MLGLSSQVWCLHWPSLVHDYPGMMGEHKGAWRLGFAQMVACECVREGRALWKGAIIPGESPENRLLSTVPGERGKRMSVCWTEEKLIAWNSSPQHSVIFYSPAHCSKPLFFFCKGREGLFKNILGKYFSIIKSERGWDCQALKWQKQKQESISYDFITTFQYFWSHMIL